MRDLKNGDKQESLRELLDFIVTQLRVTQVELSKWMDISRPLVNKFLNLKNADDVQKLTKLPIKREGLINFCEKITSKEDEANADVKALRRLFGEIGVDELLETAGLLPENTQVIRVTPERFISVAQVAALFELLPVDDLIATVQGIVSIVSSRVFSDTYNQELEPSNDALGVLIRQLEEPYQQDSTVIVDSYNPWKSHPILGVKRRIQIVEKLKNASHHLRTGGKTKFTQKEAISLFLSIAIKEQIPDYAKNLHLRVKKLDIKTLSHLITREEAQQENYQDIYQRLIKCVYEEECKLKNTDNPDLAECTSEAIDPNSIAMEDFDAVTMVVVSSSLIIKEETQLEATKQETIRTIEWTYNSSNTILENSLSACGLLLGITENGDVPNVITQTKSLDGGMSSLVESSIVLENKYQGIWVDRDSTIAILQAFISASKQWLGDKAMKEEINLPVYIDACTVISQLRNKLYKIRKQFQNFEFVNDSYTLDSLSSTNKAKSYIGNIDEIKTTLNSIAKEAQQELIKIDSTKIHFLLRLSLTRCYLLCKLLLLRLENLQGNISNVQLLIAEVENKLNEDKDIKDNLIPLQALFQTEKLLLELSLGQDCKIFSHDNSSRQEIKKDWLTKIHNAIKAGKFYKDPGLDVYHSLSEIYGNYARIELYMSDDPQVLKDAADDFLRAAHFALRIGYKQRASRWLAMCGKVWLRLNNELMCKQALIMASKIARSNLTSWQDEDLRQAICSEISLLEGENLLIIGNQPEEALNKFLIALKGSIYLRLKRRMCDALIGIYRCAQKIGDRSVQTDLKIFPSELSDPDNRSTEIVFNLLNHLQQRQDNPRWSEVSDEFAIAAAQIWQDWHEFGKSTSGNTDFSQHPIAEKIRNGTIYSQVTV